MTEEQIVIFQDELDLSGFDDCDIREITRALKEALQQGEVE